ncbi:uncharacterized protein Z518_00023 [Rhinocladiella mackenziei CBS 650.93]|uniref:Uncharacterized protein n=1 Tax=Rhinocladiella mackenziei CBS 650.93 TaxID=1442369 RepID=A0A0D2JHY1_9EURO|nr:uncharacterized protein Z518_00023 [Rhinocladiella mackenziei CBS 650.93]KIX08945.1 hypothetical protein Z518_00023 [Rhinocladiella mackenziei CBS 650.93]
MTVIDSSASFKSILPSTPKAGIQSCRSQSYKRIRWRSYDPSKKLQNFTPDPFVQWHPPNSSHDNSDEDVKKLRKRQTMDVDREPRSLVPSPIQSLPSNGTRVDPFLTLPIKATECVQDAMDYFVTICKGFNTEKSIVPGPVNPHLSLLLPFALKHAILFESMIAVCRASVLLSLGRSIFEDSACVQHRGNAIAGLNATLQSKECTDDAALLTVTMLMTLEYLTGNQHGVLMHCQGLEKMLQLRGPLSEDEDRETESDWMKFVKLGLTAYKALGSFVTGQPPDIPPDSLGYLSETFQELTLDQPLSYPEMPFPPELCLVLSRLPSGLSELCLASRISVQMINVLSSISGATTILTSLSLQDGMFTPPSPDSPNYGEDRRQSMIQTLLSSLRRMSLTSTVPIEYHLTSGLLSYLFQLRSLSPLNLFYDPILRKFITTLPFHTKPSALQEQHCLIWASLSVAGALALRVVPMPDSHTVMDRVLDLYPVARKWPQLEKILRSYFWTDEMGAHWKCVWGKAMSRRQFILRQSQGSVESHAMLELEQPDSHPDQVRERIRVHIKGAPRSMIEMAQGIGVCPFRPRPPAVTPG